MQLAKVPRVRLCHLPTPLWEMPRLSKKLGGPRILMKRDDLTGLACGGNKSRKLEYLMGDALSKKAEIIVAGSGWQSNFVTQVISAAKRVGLKIMVWKRVVDEEYEPDEEGSDGNALLHFLQGVPVKLVGPPGETNISKVMEEMMEECRDEGLIPYGIKNAGSMGPGVLGYVNATLELMNQTNEAGIDIDYVVHASGTGGTQAGLVLGRKMMNPGWEVVGIAIDRLGAEIKRVLANEGAAYLGLNLNIGKEDITLIDDYPSGKKLYFGEVNEEVIEAIRLTADLEGVFLDPAYTGKAMAGLIHLVKNGYFEKDDTVVFIHTGGVPALFMYKQVFYSMIRTGKSPWLKPPWSYHDSEKPWKPKPRPVS